ncbi:MAG: T9SS type A sorting domain-containing protein [Balneolaceae bacterium]|nr:T9SS type A sorting domain-containing protein [Balneolaceae bacterium]
MDTYYLYGHSERSEEPSQHQTLQRMALQILRKFVLDDLKKKLSYIIILLLLVGSGVQAQTITELEYFFNTDPGVGAATSITTFTTGNEITFTGDIDASSLPKGIHTLFIRAKDSDDNWGLPVKKLVLVDEGSVIEIEAMEYFFDTDPGVGTGSLISVSTGTEIDLTTDIDASGVSLGIHTLFIRAKSTSGNWGLPIKKLVLIDKDDPSTISQIVSAEYFFDVDPGFGNAQFLELEDASELEETVSLIADSLTVGLHTLYIRVLDEDGEWSMIVNQEITVTIPPELENLESDTLFVVENSENISITDSLIIKADGDFLIDSAIVDMREFVLENEEMLFISPFDSIEIEQQPGYFKLTGSASAARYQQMLRSVSYSTFSETPSEAPKTISFQVFGNDDSSEVASRTIQVTAVDDLPEKFAELPGIHLPEDVSDSLVITLSGYFRDVDSPIEYFATSQTEQIGVQLIADSLYITATENWFGEGQIQLRVSSNGLELKDSLSVTILPINDEPIATKEIPAVELLEDFEAFLMANLDTLFSDPDLPNDSLRFAINADGSGNISASIKDGNIILNSRLDANGEFSFTVMATDDSAATDSIEISGIVQAVNDAPYLIEALPDTSVDEDAAEFSLLTLSDYFRDVDSELEFEVVNNPANIHLLIKDTNELIVSADPNWNGMQEVVIAATDGEFQINDTLVISVRSINDAAPTQPVLLAPNMHSESTINAYLVWSLAKDTVAFEDPRPLYQIQIDSTTTFENPVVNQSDIGLSTILKATSMKSMFPSVQQEPGDEDSVFAVRLGSLNGSDLLEDDVHYYWRVRSVDNEDSASVWSEPWNFWLNLENDAPMLAKDGFTPADSITVSSVNPVLSWNAGSDPDFSDTPNRLSYIVELSSENEFTQTQFIDTTALGVNSVKAKSLNDEAIYFWRVKVRDDDWVESPWSAVQAFIINQKLDPPNPFELLSPLNTVDTLTTTPTFVWQSTSDSDLFDYVTYRYRISSDSMFNEVIFEGVSQADTTFVPETDLDIGTYFWQVAAVDTDSLVTWASNSENEPFSFEITQKVSNEMTSSVPRDFTLNQNYPNPFNPSSTIQFGIPEASNVRLEVFNLLGQKVSTLVAGDKMQAGWHSIQFDAGNLASGVYIYRIEAGSFVQTKRMMLIK